MILPPFCLKRVHFRGFRQNVSVDSLSTLCRVERKSHESLNESTFSSEPSVPTEVEGHRISAAKPEAVFDVGFHFLAFVPSSFVVRSANYRRYALCGQQPRPSRTGTKGFALF